MKRSSLWIDILIHGFSFFHSGFFRCYPDISKRKLICCVWTWQVPSRGWICLELARILRLEKIMQDVCIYSGFFCISLKATAAWMFLFQDDFVELLFQVYIMYFPCLNRHIRIQPKLISGWRPSEGILSATLLWYCCWLNPFVFTHPGWCRISAINNFVIFMYIYRFCIHEIHDHPWCPLWCQPLAKFYIHTVDGSEIPNNHRLDVKKTTAYSGINCQVPTSTADFYGFLNHQP